VVVVACATIQFPVVLVMAIPCDWMWCYAVLPTRPPLLVHRSGSSVEPRSKRYWKDSTYGCCNILRVPIVKVTTTPRLSSQESSSNSALAWFKCLLCLPKEFICQSRKGFLFGSYQCRLPHTSRDTSSTLDISQFACSEGYIIVADLRKYRMRVFSGTKSVVRTFGSYIVPAMVSFRQLMGCDGGQSRQHYRHRLG
jgi:hypothetical protein